MIELVGQDLGLCQGLEAFIAVYHSLLDDDGSIVDGGVCFRLAAAFTYAILFDILVRGDAQDVASKEVLILDEFGISLSSVAVLRIDQGVCRRHQ